MKPIHIPKGERKRILWKVSNSLQQSFAFTAEPANRGDTLAGTIEVSGSSWIFTKPSTYQPLEAENTVSKGMWDTFFSVYVEPECDVEVTFQQPQVDNFGWLAVIGTVVVVVAIALTVADFF